MATAVEKSIACAYRLARRPKSVQQVIDFILTIRTCHITVLKYKILEYLGDDFSAFQFETNLWRFGVRFLGRWGSVIRTSQANAVRRNHIELVEKVPAFIKEHHLEQYFSASSLTTFSRLSYWEHCEGSCGTDCHRATCVAVLGCNCKQPLNATTLKRYGKEKRKRRRYRLRGPYA